MRHGVALGWSGISTLSGAASLIQAGRRLVILRRGALPVLPLVARRKAMRNFGIVLAITLCAMAPLVALAAAPQAAPPSAGAVDPALVEDLVYANRILYDQGVLDAFGHVSMRDPGNANRFLLSRSMAPALE